MPDNAMVETVKKTVSLSPLVVRSLPRCVWLGLAYGHHRRPASKRAPDSKTVMGVDAVDLSLSLSLSPSLRPLSPSPPL